MKLKKIYNWLLLIPFVLTAQSVYASGDSGHLPDIIGSFFHEGLILHFKSVIFAMVVSVIFCFFAIMTYRKRQMIPGPLQNVMEMMVEGMYNFIHSILGKDARKYVPFLGTLFFYILGLNLMGIVPWGHAPSSNLSITASLAIMVFLYAQYTGIRSLGVVGYLDHLCLAHAACGNAWGSKPHTACHSGRARIKWDGVLVHRNSCLVQRLFGLLACDSLAVKVYEHKMVLGAA